MIQFEKYMFQMGWFNHQLVFGCVWMTRVGLKFSVDLKLADTWGRFHRKTQTERSLFRMILR